MSFRKHYRVPSEQACRRFDAWDTGGSVLHLKGLDGWLCGRELSGVDVRNEWNLLGDLCVACRQAAETRSWQAPDDEWDLIGSGALVWNLRTDTVHRAKRGHVFTGCGQVIGRDRYRLFRVPGLLGDEGFCKVCWRCRTPPAFQERGIIDPQRPERSFELGSMITLRNGKQAIYYEPTTNGHRVKICGMNTSRVVREREIR